MYEYFGISAAMAALFIVSAVMDRSPPPEKVYRLRRAMKVVKRTKANRFAYQGKESPPLKLVHIPLRAISDFYEALEGAYPYLSKQALQISEKLILRKELYLDKDCTALKDFEHDVSEMSKLPYLLGTYDLE